MKAIIIILVVHLFIIFFLNSFMCSQSESKSETIFFSMMLGIVMFILLFHYGKVLSAYATEKTIVEMENQEIKYEVTSIDPNTGKVLTIKLNEE